MKLNIKSTALMFGTFAALMHAVWSLIVFLGLGNDYLNWIMGLHFLSNPYKVAPFNATTAATLVVATFVIGTFVGWLFATVWNYLKKGK